MQSEQQGAGCGAHTGGTEQGQYSAGKRPSLLLIVDTDILGREEAIGNVLIKGFFETMKVHNQLPHMMFFLNAGVKLTTVNQEIVPILQEIAAMGVDIYSCGTCLKHYDLESTLQVGHRGATIQLVEGLRDFEKIVWI